MKFYQALPLLLGTWMIFLVFSPDMETHIKHLRSLFKKIEKCRFKA